MPYVLHVEEKLGGWVPSSVHEAVFHKRSRARGVAVRVGVARHGKGGSCAFFGKIFLPVSRWQLAG